MRTIRIGAGQGFWGDRIDAPASLLRGGQLDYIMMDYLAEVTMSIMQKQKQKNPALGYARDFPVLMDQLLPELVKKNVKIVSNAGGVNPLGCAESVVTAARKHGLKGLKVAVVHGDDILARLKDFIAAGHPLANMDTGAPLSTVLDKVVSANIYFGAWPVAEALSKGAHIVITGRCTDTGLTLAPMLHEFGWTKQDLDKIAAGTVAGHILECGAQASGGNFSADWRSVPDMDDIGYPIGEVAEDGTFVITKHEGQGGIVTEQTVKEQLLYELGDPLNYITPDGTVDFTSIQVAQDGKDRVRVHGVKGGGPTPTYKVSIAYQDGWKASGSLTYTWPDALEKARQADRALRGRLRRLGLSFEDVHTEFLGLNACHGPLAVIPDAEEVNEIVLRVGVRGHDMKAVERFGYEIAPLILTGPPSVTGFAGGRPKPSEVIAYWPALLDKTVATPVVDVLEA